MNPDKYLIGDSTDLLKQVPRSSVGLIVTDPAYSSLEKWRKMGTTTRLKQSKSSSNDWFPTVENDYFGPFFKECFRALRRPGHIYVMCDDEMSYILRPALEAAGFAYRKKIIWRKVGKDEPINCPHCGGVAATRQRPGQPGMGYPFRSSYEVVLLAEKGKRPAPRDRKVRDFIDVDDWPDWESLWLPEYINILTDVVEIPRIKPSRGGKAVYPTQKPLSLLRTLIRQSSNPGDLVLDPFAGSGSTLLAAAQEDRDYLGFDISTGARDFCRARQEWIGVGEVERTEASVGGVSESDFTSLFGG